MPCGVAQKLKEMEEERKEHRKYKTRSVEDEKKPESRFQKRCRRQKTIKEMKMKLKQVLKTVDK